MPHWVWRSKAVKLPQIGPHGSQKARTLLMVLEASAAMGTIFSLALSAPCCTWSCTLFTVSWVLSLSLSMPASACLAFSTSVGICAHKGLGIRGVRAGQVLPSGCHTLDFRRSEDLLPHYACPSQHGDWHAQEAWLQR